MIITYGVPPKKRTFRAYCPEVDAWWTQDVFNDFNREFIFFIDICPMGTHDVNKGVMHWENYDGLPFYGPHKEKIKTSFYDAILMEKIGDHYEGDVLVDGKVIGNIFDGTKGEYIPIVNSFNYLLINHGGPL